MLEGSTVRYGRTIDPTPIQNLDSNKGFSLPTTVSLFSQSEDIRQVSGPSMISSENGLLVVTVLLNVRGRDVGSFVDEARQVLAQSIQLPQGSYIEWSGQYENEVRARRRLQIVMPVVLLVIYLLLYVTYHSFLEAGHVLLAVPFALSGGLFLLYGLGYNFSVAVWVGFIALFGTAVQTAVVMVIYLEEGRDRRGPPQASAEGHDGLHRGRKPPAHHGESLHGGGGDEAAGDPGPGWDGKLARPRVTRHPGHFLLAERAGAPSRGGRTG